MRNKLKRLLFIPDTHVPYHDKRAFALMLKVAKSFKPDTIVIEGDFADFYSVSSHSKNPMRANQLDNEIAAVNEELDELDKLGATRKLFVSGNHEFRLERYLEEKAPELFSMIQIPVLFKLAERGWEYTPYREDAKVGKLYVTHDVGSSGRGSIYKALDTYQHNIVTGHTHRIAYIVEGSATGERRVSAQFGWLGSTEAADYMHRVKAAKDWSLGFGIGYLDPKTEHVFLVPVPIVDYTCVVNGELYRG